MRGRIFLMGEEGQAREANVTRRSLGKGGNKNEQHPLPK
jgi:hypothetical protein